MTQVRWLYLCAALLALALAGCAGYRLGPAGGATPGARTVQIDPFVNKTLEPRLSDYMMTSLRQNLMQDGTYRVDTHDTGDIILTGVMTNYQRRALSFNPNDVLTAQDYELILTAQVTARERSTGKILFDKPVTGKTELRVGTDLTSAERQAMPLRL